MSPDRLTTNASATHSDAAHQDHPDPRVNQVRMVTEVLQVTADRRVNQVFPHRCQLDPQSPAASVPTDHQVNLETLDSPAVLAKKAHPVRAADQATKVDLVSKALRVLSVPRAHPVNPEKLVLLAIMANAESRGHQAIRENVDRQVLAETQAHLATLETEVRLDVPDHKVTRDQQAGPDNLATQVAQVHRDHRERTPSTVLALPEAEPNTHYLTFSLETFL